MDVGRPVEILDKMIDLERWWESERGQRNAEIFINSMEHNKEHGFNRMVKDPANFGGYLAFALQRSLPYFVTDQMVDKIWSFSKGFETVGFFPEDVPSRFGFMWLAKPVYTLDINGEMQCTRAVTWSQQPEGVALFFYADRHDDFDEVNLKMRAQMGEKYNLIVSELSLNHAQPVLWGEMTPWSFGDPEEYAAKNVGPFGANYDPVKVRESNEEHFALCRFVLACWEWMGYQLPSRQLPHRQMARRLGRSRLDARDVLVIDLQATERADIPPATNQVVEWHYRWRVREHKRHWVDKYGNLRETTVHSYIKGPEGAPLVERDILFNMRRGHAPV